MMALNPIAPTLRRRVRYDAVSPAKPTIVVQPGAVLDVPEDIAAQLFAASAQFKADDADVPAEPVDDSTDDDEPAPKARRKR